MEIEFITYKNIKDGDILRAFGETLHFLDGEFERDAFIDLIKKTLEVKDLYISEISKKEILQRLKDLVVELEIKIADEL